MRIVVILVSILHKSGAKIQHFFEICKKKVKKMQKNAKKNAKCLFFCKKMLNFVEKIVERRTIGLRNKD